MRRTLIGLGCAVMLAAAVSPISFANDRGHQDANNRDSDREHDDDDRDDDDRVAERGKPEWRFKRVGTFANFRNAGLANLTVSEIIASTPDGRTLIYSDAEGGAIGFIDITNPATPLPAGTVALDPDPTTAPNYYSPTSVAVLRNQYVLVAVDTSLSKKQPSGELQVIDLTTRTKVATIDLHRQTSLPR